MRTHKENTNVLYKILAICCTFLFILTCCLLFCSCSDIDKDDSREQAKQNEEYLLSQMLPINYKYSIINKNSEEIVLNNYDLGRVEIYDKHGTSFRAYSIENHTVFHNWYIIEKNDDGIFDIMMTTIDRPENFSTYYNNELRVIHDRALQINLSPYSTLMFASGNGEDKYRNTTFEFENSSKIKYAVKTKVTMFETTKILNIIEGPWNTYHTLQFCTYEISLIKVIFEDASYQKASIMEYRFRTEGIVDENMYSVFETGEIKGKQASE